MNAGDDFRRLVNYNLTIALSDMALGGWTRVPHREELRFTRNGEEADLVRRAGSPVWYLRPVQDVEDNGLWQVERDRKRTAKAFGWTGKGNE